MLVFQTSGVILVAVASLLSVTGVALQIEGMKCQHTLYRINGLALTTLGIAHILFVLWG